MIRKMEAQGLRIVNTIFFLLMIIVNVAAEILPLNHVTTAEVSARHDTLLTPPGFTFAIWGLIYVWLFLFILFQNGLFHKKGEGDNPDIIRAVSAFFIVSSILNIGWIIAWHFEYISLSCILIFAMWASLIFAYSRIKKEASSGREHFFIHMPFSVYVAWISVAMTINFIAMIKDAAPQLLGLSETSWSKIFIIGIALLTEFILIRFRDFIFAFTALWAFGGILYHYAVDISKQNLQSDMLLLLAVTIGVLLISLLITAWVQRYKPYMS